MQTDSETDCSLHFYFLETIQLSDSMWIDATAFEKSLHIPIMYSHILQIVTAWYQITLPDADNSSDFLNFHLSMNRKNKSRIRKNTYMYAYPIFAS